MGSDARKLAYDGYPAGRILGLDVFADFISLGHELYDDYGSCDIQFLAIDIFSLPVIFDYNGSSCASETISALAKFRGSMTHIYAGGFFHLFDEQTQHQLALRLVCLLKRKHGAIVFGRHEGFEVAQRIPDPPEWQSVLGSTTILPAQVLISFHRTNRYGHSPSSWMQLWLDVFAKVEDEEFAKTRVETFASLTEEFGGRDDTPWRPPRTVLVWSVRII